MEIRLIDGAATLAGSDANEEALRGIPGALP